MHLGFDDIDRTGARIPDLTIAQQVMLGDERGEDGIQYALGHFVAVLVENGINGHKVTDIADQHQAAPGHHQFVGTIRFGIHMIGVQFPMNGLAALLEAFRQIAPHKAEPIAVHNDFIIGINGGDRILAIHDGRDRGFHNDVGDVRRVVFADRVACIEPDFEMNTIIDESDRRRRCSITKITCKMPIILQPDGFPAGQRHSQLRIPDRIARCIRVAATCKRRSVIQKTTCIGDHLGAAHRIVTAAKIGTAILGNRVRAIKGVIQAAPAGIGGVQRIARIHNRHDQLRSRDSRNLRIHVIRIDGESVAFLYQVTDLGKERFIRGRVEFLTFAGLVPGVDLRLQRIPSRQQFAVPGREVTENLVYRAPKSALIYIRSGKRLFIYKVVQRFSYLQRAHSNTFSHSIPLGHPRRGPVRT